MRFDVVLSPSCPLPLYPQAYTAPSLFTAIENRFPAATRETPVSDATAVGLVRWMVVPFPNCPKLLLPQAQAVPSALTARL